MKPIRFKNRAAQTVYDKYLLHIKQATKSLPKQEQQEVLMELNSHIYEGLNKYKGEDDLVKLNNIISQLNISENYTAFYKEDSKDHLPLDQDNSKSLGQTALLYFIRAFSYTILAILYICILGIGFLIYSKLRNPEEVGLYFKDNDFELLGRISTETALSLSYEEQLESWFIPVMIGVMIVSYIIIKLILKALSKLK